ncbi:MAG: hypothetical protein L7F77_05470 [Candidatus Magnetominusculus sp. LBB02]|nr:hypothetical protein [Candidatus Magnetominusculus sp. LBB02]
MKNRPRITIGEVRDKYAALYDNWLKHTSPHETYLSVIAETSISRGLGESAEYIAEKEGRQTVIFGHSHIPELSRINLNKSVYANTGTWCKKTFSEDYYIAYPYNLVITEETEDKYIVKLCCWKSKEEKDDNKIFVEQCLQFDASRSIFVECKDDHMAQSTMPK